MREIRLTNDTFDDVVALAVGVLRDGGVVAMPMDTSYGLAADATDESAVRKVFNLKERDPEMALSVVVRDRKMARGLADLTPQAERLWDIFIPGHLTIIVPLSQPLPYLSDTVGLRRPDNKLTEAVSDAFGRPYTATSANRSGWPPAYTAEELKEQFTERQPDLLIDGGAIKAGPSSTVVRMTGSEPEIIRQGPIPEADLRSALE